MDSLFRTIIYQFTSVTSFYWFLETQRKAVGAYGEFVEAHVFMFELAGEGDAGQCEAIGVL